MKNYVLCLVVSFLCVCRPVCAQKIEHFGVEEGLGGIQTFSITQDKTGFIWIATRFGVNRLDGKNIKNYPIPVISNGQSPIRLTHVLLDRDSTLWCYTDRGAIYKYNNNRDEFVCNNDLELYLRHVFFDENNDLWVGTRSFFGILKKDSLHVINTNELKNNEFKQFHPFDSSGFLVVANHTVYHFDIRSEKLICLLTNERLAGKPSFESIYYDRNENKIWIGCAGQGLFLYEISSGRCEPVENRELLYQPLLVIRELNAQYLLLGTDGKGLCLLDRIEKKIVRMYNYHSPKEMRIKGNGVYDIYRDKSGKVWISTFSDGVYVFDFKKQDFHVIRHEENNDNSLLHNVVCDILCDSNNNLWFATNYGISHWNRKNNRW
ncbi:MAG: hypothetical protein LBG77_06190, partial [Dysgonamonadaceae bacterium]|nr:hypothetical protein [Dysgonamonadaceae bacterium]